MRSEICRRGPFSVGIHMGHDASVSLCSPRGIEFSLAEERLARIKHYSGFPLKAIRYLFEELNFDAREIVAVAFSASKQFFPEHKTHRIVDEHGRCRDPESVDVPPEMSERWSRFAERHWSRNRHALEQYGLTQNNLPYYCVAHHRAHASGAFRTSDMDAAAILTLDGWGGNVSSLIARGNPDGSIETLRVSHERDSVGSFYQAVTEALGFTPVDGEHKTMGLAALGTGKGNSQFEDLIEVRDGVLRSKMHWTYRDYNQEYPEKQLHNPLESICEADYFRSLLSSMSPVELAEGAQHLCESVMVNLSRDALRISGQERLTVAGGVMLNVKGNHRICEELGVSPKEFFVFPDATDSGLASGAAFEALHQLGSFPRTVALSTPYLGPEYSEQEICDALLDSAPEIVVEKPDGDFANAVAAALVEGKVIGCFQGAMEIGPRALGNRSVLADPRTAEVKDRINLILKGRDPFVPFAPVILAEDAARYIPGCADYKYMTFAVPALENTRKLIPGAVHVDGTVRPQLVTRESNPFLYQVLLEFRRLTGVSVLINTSFNRHGLPIVGTPKDAVEHLKNSWVDMLAIAPFLVQRRD